MMNQVNQSAEKQEKNDIAIRSRKHMDITGVKEVLSFDDCSVAVVTCLGEIHIDGEDLKIDTLDTGKGIVSVDGKINAVVYCDEQPQSVKRRLFGGAFKP